MEIIIIIHGITAGYHQHHRKRIKVLKIWCFVWNKWLGSIRSDAGKDKKIKKYNLDYYNKKGSE